MKKAVLTLVASDGVFVPTKPTSEQRAELLYEIFESVNSLEMPSLTRDKVLCELLKHAKALPNSPEAQYAREAIAEEVMYCRKRDMSKEPLEPVIKRLGCAIEGPK